MALLNSIRTRAALALLSVAGIAAGSVVAGCGDAVPSDAVAKVGDTVITKAAYAHWLSATAQQQARSQAAASPGAPATPPDPPNFTKCVAAKSSQAVPKGVPKPTPAQLKTSCQQEYTALRDQTMQFLISAQWLIQEAAKRGIKPTDQQVRTSFEQQKRAAFPHPADYQKFLQSSGQTEQDLLFRVRLSVITNKLQQQIVSKAGNVSQQEIATYYAQNKSRFGRPEMRDLLVVLNPKQNQAQAALKAIQSGKSWASVAKKYSTDQASKAQAGKLLGVVRGQQERTFDQAIFSAPKDKLEGPVKTQFGYYVFRVTNIAPARQDPLSVASLQIRNLLRSQRQQKALNNFVQTFQTTYRDQTTCGSGYVVARVCNNGPKQQQPVSGQSPQTGAPQAGGGTSGAPQTGAPSGAPQSGAPPAGGAPSGSAPQSGAPSQGQP